MAAAPCAEWWSWSRPPCRKRSPPQRDRANTLGKQKCVQRSAIRGCTVGEEAHWRTATGITARHTAGRPCCRQSDGTDAPQPDTGQSAPQETQQRKKGKRRFSEEHRRKLAEAARQRWALWRAAHPDRRAQQPASQPDPLAVSVPETPVKSSFLARCCAGAQRPRRILEWTAAACPKGMLLSPFHPPQANTACPDGPALCSPIAALLHPADVRQCGWSRSSSSRGTPGSADTCSLPAGCSPETRAKIAAAATGRRWGLDVRYRMSRSHAGKVVGCVGASGVLLAFVCDEGEGACKQHGLLLKP